MIAEDVGDSGLLPVHPEDLLDDRVGLGAPEPPPAEFPAVDDVAHEVKMAALVVVQERQQKLGLAVPAAQVKVRDPDRVVFHDSGRFLRNSEGVQRQSAIG